MGVAQVLAKLVSRMPPTRPASAAKVRETQLQYTLPIAMGHDAGDADRARKERPRVCLIVPA